MIQETTQKNPEWIQSLQLKWAKSGTSGNRLSKTELKREVVELTGSEC